MCAKKIRPLGHIIPLLLHMMPRPYYTFEEHDDLADREFPFYDRALGTLMIFFVDGHPRAPLDSKMLSSSFLALRILDDVSHAPRLALTLIDGYVLTWSANDDDHR